MTHERKSNPAAHSSVFHHKLVSQHGMVLFSPYTMKLTITESITRRPAANTGGAMRTSRSSMLLPESSPGPAVFELLATNKPRNVTPNHAVMIPLTPMPLKVFHSRVYPAAPCTGVMNQRHNLCSHQGIYNETRKMAK